MRKLLFGIIFLLLSVLVSGQYTSRIVSPSDLPRCFEEKTDWGGSEIDCVRQIALLNKDHLICNSINPVNLAHTQYRPVELESFKQRCVIDVAIVLNDFSLCNEVTDSYIREQCVSHFTRVQSRENANIYYLLLIPFLGLLVLILTCLKMKFRESLTIITFALVPLLVIPRYFFNLEPLYIRWIAHGDANLHMVILLFYGILCFISVILNLDHSYTKWRENDITFKNDLQRTYIFAIAYAIIISLLHLISFQSLFPSVSFQSLFPSGVNMFALIFFLFFAPGNALLFAVGILSFIYVIKGNPLKETKQKAFLTYTTRAAIIFILLGALSALWVVPFWIFGAPSFHF